MENEMKDFLNDTDELELFEEGEFEDDFMIDESDSEALYDDAENGTYPGGEDDDRCDLDPTKICDNCFRCLDNNLPDYEEIKIGEIILDMDEHAFDIADTPFKYED